MGVKKKICFCCPSLFSPNLFCLLHTEFDLLERQDIIQTSKGKITVWSLCSQPTDVGIVP